MSALRPMGELREEARGFLSRGDVQRARAALWNALQHAVAREEDYVNTTVELRDLMVRLGDFRGALTLDWYAGSERSQRPLLEKVPPIDRAKTVLSWAERQTKRDPGRAKELFAQAADEYEAAGLTAQAAIARERGGDFERARALWSRLSQVLSPRGADLYTAGLARFNLARTSEKTGDAQAARSAVVEAVHLLEQAADRYETIGQRERAFDCFQVLIAIGKDCGQFEHVLEGYVNVIRILREDHLRYYALQSYEEALNAAEKQGEAAAAATLAREMASYARKETLPQVANFAMLAQARLWQEVAALCQKRAFPPEIAENAMLASVIAYGESGQYSKVGAAYGALSGLPLEESRKKHYAKAEKRYQGASDLPIDASPLPAHLRQEVGFPEVWHLDLIEWEQRGSVAQACSDVVLDPGQWSEVTRRKAMLARLTALPIEAEEETAAQGAKAPRKVPVEQWIGLCEQLSQVDLYSLLSPLERLFERPEREVRMAVVKTLAKFPYKRTFITLREALLDRDLGLVKEASKALEEFRFAHAFDPLSRIYREAQNDDVKVSALRALSKIDTVEAAEMLLGVLSHDGQKERGAAVEALKKSRGMKFIDMARGSFRELSAPAQAQVREILNARGVSI